MPNASVAIVAKWDSRQVKAALSKLAPKQWAFATAVALTRTAQRVKVAEIDTMRRVFDRPMPFTLNSLYLKSATKSNQEARVWFKDFAPKGTPAGKYLLPEVHGGERHLKRFEQALIHAGLLPHGRALVPASGAPLDAYGNVKRSVYQKILSQLRAQFDPTANETRRSRSRKAKQRGGRYFYGSPGHKARGVWERFQFAFGSSVRPIFIEVNRRPKYRQRFAFFDVGQEIADKSFGEEFDKAATETLRTAR